MYNINPLYLLEQFQIHLLLEAGPVAGIIKNGAGIMSKTAASTVRQGVAQQGVGVLKTGGLKTAREAGLARAATRGVKRVALPTKPTTVMKGVSRIDVPGQPTTPKPLKSSLQAGLERHGGGTLKSTPSIPKNANPLVTSQPSVPKTYPVAVVNKPQVPAVKPTTQNLPVAVSKSPLTPTTTPTTAVVPVQKGGALTTTPKVERVKGVGVNTKFKDVGVEDAVYTMNGKTEGGSFARRAGRTVGQGIRKGRQLGRDVKAAALRKQRLWGKNATGWRKDVKDAAATGAKYGKYGLYTAAAIPVAGAAYLATDK